MKQETIKNQEFLNNIPLPQIAEVFANFGSQNEGRTTVIPIGFPQAGKSLFLSSLLHYARSAKNETLFRIVPESAFPFDKGRLALDQMISYFNKGELYEATATGTIDLIGLDLIPANPKLETLRLAFLDLAGEDIQKIKISNNGGFTEKIKAVFNGLQVNEAPIIFTLITPFEPPSVSPNSYGSNMEDHNTEDTLHFDFLTYIEREQPNILTHSKIFIIVSQWDKNKDSSLTVEQYIRKFRPSIYQYVANLNVIWGSYTVGKLLVQKDENGISYQKIITRNEGNPERFWKKLYKITSGEDLDKKSWWEKIFG